MSPSETERAERRAARIKEFVDACPPLTEEQRAYLSTFITHRPHRSRSTTADRAESPS